jgi:hypothetical protein
MLEHSRGVSGERREVDLDGLIEEALNLAYHGARARDTEFNITLERESDPDLAHIELAPPGDDPRAAQPVRQRRSRQEPQDLIYANCVSNPLIHNILSSAPHFRFNFK